MTKNHVWASLFSILTVIVGILQQVAPVIPGPWGALLVAILGVFSAYHIFQSGTPLALGKAGYFKQ